MSAYTMIESRDPFESKDCTQLHELALQLRAAGHEVVLYLIQNGVLGARRSPASAALTALARAGVGVLADDFSLRERAIEESRLERGVGVADIEILVDHLAAGHRVLWH
jgi:hypothetical protein